MSRWVGVFLVLFLGCAPRLSTQRDGGATGRGDAMPPRIDADAPDLPDSGTFDAARPLPGIDASTEPDAGACPETGCCYRRVHAEPGEFHTVTVAAPQRTVQPLGPGEGVYCLRVEYTVEVPNNMAALDAAYEGCPIYSHLATMEGGTADGRVLSTGFFRFLRLGCSPRVPAALEINAWTPAGGVGDTRTGPWLPGQTYRITHRVEPFTSTLEVRSTDGTLLGPAVATDISGFGVVNTRDLQIAFGLDRVYENAFFPLYEATYRDLEVWADVAPAAE